MGGEKTQQLAVLTLLQAARADMAIN